MGLKDFKDVAKKQITIKKLKDENDEDLVIEMRPLTMNKAMNIIMNYDIFVEELIFNQIDFEKLDDIEYVNRFGFEKFDEAISYCIAVACNEEEFAHVVKNDFPWEYKVEAFEALLELSLPEDKKKADKMVQTIINRFGQPVLQLLQMASPKSQTESEDEESEDN